MWRRGGMMLAVKRKVRDTKTPSSAARSEREVLRCGELLVDVGARQVRVAGLDVELPPKVYELLLVFLREPGVVHTREALFQRLWPGTVVLDANLTTALSQLRKALDPDNRARIRTVPRVGYAFDGSVAVEPEADDDGDPEADEPAADSPLPVSAGNDAEFGRPPSARMPSATRWRQAAMFLAVLIALALAWWLRSAPPARPVMVVSALAKGGADGWIGQAVRDGLRRRLSVDPSLRIVDRGSSVGDALIAQAQGDSSSGADFEVIAEVEPGDGPQAPVALSLRLLRASDGRSLYAQAQTVSMDQLLERLDVMTSALHRAATGRDLPAAAPVVPLAAVQDYHRALKFEQRYDYPAARRELERALEAAPGFSLAEERLAEVLRKMGYRSLAAGLYRRLSADAGLPPEGRALSAARALSLAGATPAAIEAFRKLAFDFPDEPRHAIELVRVLARGSADDRREGRRTIDALAERKPMSDIEILRRHASAQLYDLDGEHARAAAELEIALELAEREGLWALAGDAAIDLGRMQQRLGRREESQRTWQRAATLHRQAGLPISEASAQLNMLLSRRWDTPPLDDATIEAGVRAHLDRAEALGAADLHTQGLIVLAENLEFAERESDALVAVDKAIRGADELGDESLANLASIYAARLHTKLGRPAQALTMLQPLERRYAPSSALAHQVAMAIAMAQLERGELATARSVASASIEATRASGHQELTRVGHCTLTEILKLQGEYAAAIDALRRCYSTRNGAPDQLLRQWELASLSARWADADAIAEPALAALRAMPAGMARNRLAMAASYHLLRLGQSSRASSIWRELATTPELDHAPSRVQRALLESLLAAYHDRNSVAALEWLARARSDASPESRLEPLRLGLIELALSEPAANDDRLARLQAIRDRASGTELIASIADRLAAAIAARPGAAVGSEWIEYPRD